METVIAIVVIFGLIIAIHELGHLILAKRAGILCREFAIGFGPKLFSLRKHETIYTVRLLPIGGFVRMAGEDPEMIDLKPGHRIGLIFNDAGLVSKMIVNNKSKHPEARMITVEKADVEKDLIIQGYEHEEDALETFRVDERADFIVDERAIQIAPLNRQFAHKPVGSRLLAIFAGPFMNFFLAFILFILYALFLGVPTDEAKLGELVEDRPAMQAGLEQGDRVLAVDGNTVDSWEELTATIEKHPNDTVQFKVERNGEVMTVPVTPYKVTLENGEAQGKIGVYAPTETSLLGSIQFGAERTVQWTVLIIDAVGQLVTGQIGIDGLSGPVGIYSFTGEAASEGIFTLIRWAAFLSINVGIFNLLPLPALDGGRLVFLGIEAVRGKPVDPKKESLVHFVGLALLFLLMIVVTWNDIHRFFLDQ